MKPYQEYVLSVKAYNKFGVLTRVITQIRREGCNIKSLNVAETIDKSISIMNINVESYNYLFEDILKRLGNLSCVLQVDVCSGERGKEHISKEYALINIKDNLKKVEGIIEKYQLKLVDDEKVYEISALSTKIDELTLELKDKCEVAIVRSGVINIFKGGSAK